MRRRISKQTSGRRVYFILLFVFAFTLVASLLMLNGGDASWVKKFSEEFSEKTTSTKDKDEAEKSVEIKLEFPLVFLAKFKYLNQNIALKDLKNQKIYIDKRLIDQLNEEEKQQLLNKLEISTYKEFADSKLIDFNLSKYPDNALLLTHFSNADFRLKQLKIDDKNLFKDKTYPLNISISRQLNVNSSTADEVNNKFKADFASGLGLKNSNSLEFDKAKLNSLFIGGEMIPARAVDRLFLNKTDNYTFLYDRLADDIKNADLAIAMLENPISGNPTPCTGCTVFVGDARNAKGFAEVGFDVFGVGNHAGDGGLKAVEDTEKLLKEAKIDYTGISSKNLDGAARLVIRDFGGKKLGFLSSDDVAWFYWANETRWGTNRFSKAGRGTDVDHERIAKVVGDAKKQVDYLIVMMSWGVEYTNIANKHQTEMAHALIDNGADLIVSSHPHWVQNFEVYKGKPIFYALGNFIFDQTHTDPTRQGLVVNAYYYENELKSFEIKPILTCGYHQTSNNLASKIIDKSMTYAQVDSLSEKQGCIWWQPKPLQQSKPEYKEVWERFIEGLKL